MNDVFDCCLVTTKGTLTFIGLSSESIFVFDESRKAAIRMARQRGMGKIEVIFRITDGGRSLSFSDLLLGGVVVRKDTLNKLWN